LVPEEGGVVRKADVKVGETYIAKVSGRLVKVKLVRESSFGGWDAENLFTGREIRVRTAARLRRAALSGVGI
jgi:hypothetical protein